MNDLLEKVNMIAEGAETEFSNFIETYMYGDDWEFKRSTEKGISTLISVIIEHILKCNYCSSDAFIKKWSKEISDHQSTCRKKLKYSLKDKETLMIKHISENIDLLYKDGINKYIKDSKEHSDLPDITNTVPEKCPWTLDDLLMLNLSKLISILDVTSNNQEE